MRRHIATGLLGYTALLGATVAAGQEAELGVHGGRVTDERGAEAAGVTLAPALTWRDRRTLVRLEGQGTLMEKGALLGGAGMTAQLRLAEQGPLGLGLAASGSLGASSEGYRAAGGQLWPQLQVSFGEAGLAAGPYLGTGGQRTTVSVGGGGWFPFTSAPVERREEMRWRSVRGIAAEGWARTGPTSVRAGWRSASSGETVWRDLTASASAALGAVTVGGEAGWRSGAVEEQWLSGNVAVALSDDAALVAQAGTFPADPLMGRAGGQFATVGLRVRTGSAPGPVRPVPVTHDGRVRLSLRAEPGSRVEILGDWNGWKPEPVREASAGVYVAEVALGPGAHRFLFRVNGEWRVPEGFPTEPDGFGGKRAVIRV